MADSIAQTLVALEKRIKATEIGLDRLNGLETTAYADLALVTKSNIFTQTQTIQGGLNVGSATGATTGQVIASGDGRFQNALEVGLNASNAYVQGYNRVGAAYRAIEFWTGVGGPQVTIPAGGGLNVGSTSAAVAGAIRTSDSTRTATLVPRTAASGTGLSVGYDLAVDSNHVLNLAGALNAGSTSGGVNIGYWSPNAGVWLAALSIRNSASTYSTLNLMPDGGTTNIGSGLNVGSATGASTGEVRAGAGVYADSNYFGGMRTRTITLANNATAQLLNNTGTGQAAGILFIVENSAAGVGIFSIRGGAYATMEISDTAGYFSHTAGTAGLLNLYWSAGNNRYEIQNLVGGSRTVWIWYFAT